MDAIIGYCLDNKVYWCLTCFEQKVLPDPAHEEREIEAVFRVPTRAACAICGKVWWRRTPIDCPKTPVLPTGREWLEPSGARIQEYQGQMDRERPIYECETTVDLHYQWFIIEPLFVPVALSVSEPVSDAAMTRIRRGFVNYLKKPKEDP